MIIINQRYAAELEKLGWEEGRDFLLSQPVPVAPQDLGTLSERVNATMRGSWTGA